MSHLHSVYDTDKHFVIDPITRNISTESNKLVLTRYDHNSERFTFEIPRYIEGHDMFECNQIEIHADNIGKTNSECNSDVYTVDDKQLSPDDENIVIFSWLISRAFTQIVGKLSFSIDFACIAEDGVEEYSWGTNNFDKVSINNRIHNTQKVIEEHSDFVGIIQGRYDELAKRSATKEEVGQLSKENAELKGDLEEIAYPFNYCDIANMTVGKLVNRSDGTLSGNGDGGYIKIPVSVGDTLYVYGFCNDFITNGNVGAVYKEDGTFFQGIYATGDTFILPYTASGYSEVKYALINCKAFGSKMMIFKEPYEYSIHLPYGANIKNIIPNKSNLNDKTVLIEGDSIMYGYGSNGEGIGEILRDRYGFRLYKNAISGSTLAYVEGTENIRNRIVNGVKKPYDYIILDGGYNDYGKSLPLGSLMSESYPYASAPDATTVIGAMELIFQHIKKNYPKTKIYFVTPHKVNRVWVQVNSLNLTFKDYYDALISVCNLYSVPVIDLWNESGLTTYFSEMKVFTKDNDGLHPTKEGYEEFYLPVFQKSLGI